MAAGTSTTHPVPVEPPEGHVSCLLRRSQEVPCDQVAGDHEEYVDADEAAAWPTEQLSGEHHEHGHHPKALDI